MDSPVAFRRAYAGVFVPAGSEETDRYPKHVSNVPQVPGGRRSYWYYLALELATAANVATRHRRVINATKPGFDDVGDHSARMVY
jgi:hypothetical protein